MQLQCNETEKHDKSDWHISRNAHQNAFETLIQYIQDEMVKKKGVFIIFFLFKVFFFFSYKQTKNTK